MSLIEQRTQIRQSRAYDDARTSGSTMESAPVNLEENLNDARTMLRLISGETNWYDAPATPLKAIADKFLAFNMPLIPGTADFTLGGVVGGVLLVPAMFAGGSGKIAVGASSISDGGYLAAAEAGFTVAGTLGIGLTVINDARGILLNGVDIIEATTNEAPTMSSGEQIFGLLQCLTGTSDDASIAANPSENLQMSFVYYAKGTDTLTATTLPAGTYHFAPNSQFDFVSLNRGAMLNAMSIPEFAGVIGGAGGLVRAPMREIEITGTVPAAQDPMVVTTGVFTTAGAQTVQSTYGTPALPATGAAFRDDSRIKVWLNGQLLRKKSSSGTGLFCYWVSTTQLAFGVELFANDMIYIEAPDSY